MSIEKIVLKNLFLNETYARKILPFLKDEYFSNEDDRTLFKTTRDFILKYNTRPTYDALRIQIESENNLSEDTLKNIITALDQFKAASEDTNQEWLVSSTEKFCQERAIYNAIMKSIEIMNGSAKESKGAIPQLLSDALAISFDPNVGHDYLEQYESRFDYYHRVEDKIPFDLEYFNKITKNGLPKKTLNIILAGTGVGKSLCMCHFAASWLHQKKRLHVESMPTS
jgi:replicative DNA helicase